MSSATLNLASNEPKAASAVNTAGGRVAVSPSSVPDLTQPLLKAVGQLQDTINWTPISEDTLTYQNTRTYQVLDIGATIGEILVPLGLLVIFIAVALAATVSGFFLFLMLIGPVGGLLRGYCNSQIEQMKNQDIAKQFIATSGLTEKISQAASEHKGLYISIQNTPVRFLPIHQEIVRELSKKLSTPVVGIVETDGQPPYVQMTAEQVTEHTT